MAVGTVMMFPHGHAAALGVVACLAIAPAQAGTYSAQLPPGAALPGAGACADRAYAYAGTAEIRPENAAANLRTGSSDAWRAYHHVDGDDSDVFGLRVRGNSIMSSGAKLTTTTQILVWAACKWGRDQDTVLAQAVVESSWRMSTAGDGGHSHGLLQINDIYHDATYPTSRDKTAFNVDYASAWHRACFEGHFTWLGNGYRVGDMLGCLGAWYSGNWYDGAAQQYIAWVQDELAKRRWEQPGF